jgi:hypothetical protein
MFLVACGHITSASVITWLPPPSLYVSFLHKDLRCWAECHPHPVPLFLIEAHVICKILLVKKHPA